MVSPSSLLFVVAVSAVAASASLAPVRDDVPDDVVQQAFDAFKAKYNRIYSCHEENVLRFNIFKANYQYVQESNSRQSSYALDINEFADQTPHEFKSSRFGLSMPSSGKLWEGLPHLGTDSYSGAPLPKSIDWTAKGAVTPVKNQGTCGSCWSFSATGALEGAWQVATGKLMSFSEQQLVDCSTQNNGCSGGLMDYAFAFWKDHAVCTESSYPYTAQDGTCAETSCTVGVPKGSVIGYFDVPANDEKALMEAVAKQPVSVAIEADQMAFQLYSKGILSKKCGHNLDHGVLLVGYGTENGVDYWKVKNSWGASWGEQGYIRLERGSKESKEGECGIKAQASYPEVHSGPTPPAPAPGPAPGPSPSCEDSDDVCTSSFFNPSDDCSLLSKFCRKTCGCCSSSAPAYCGQEAGILV